MEVLKVVERRIDSDFKIVIMLSRTGSEYVISILDDFHGFIGERIEMYFNNETSALIAFDNVLLVSESTNGIHEILKTVYEW